MGPDPGNVAAADLLPLVYSELRAVAEREVARERANHTLGATALVHEAYLRIASGRRIPWANRYHFFAAASEAMRRILIDHGRARSRSPARRPCNLTEVDGLDNLACADHEDRVRFDGVFQSFEAIWPEPAEVFRLRFFGGLTVAMTASVLGISKSSVDRRWAFARAWIYEHLNG